MMKSLLHIQIVAGFLFLLVSSKVGAEISIDPSLDSSQKITIEQEYFKFARVLAKSYGAEILGRPLKVTTGQTGNKLALYSQGEIRLKSSKSFTPSVLRHELAHFALERLCPRVTNQFVHEIFAILASEDYLRLGVNKSFILKRTARSYLVDNRNSKIGPKAQAAIARLLASKERRKTMKDSFKTLFETCKGSNGKSVDTELVVNSFLDEQKISFGPINIAVIDGSSGRKLYSNGSLNQRFPIGSILKPFVVAEMPSIQRAISSKANSFWSCPNGESYKRIWDWPEALAKSCNGFFLDQQPKPSELSSIVSKLESFGVRGNAFSMQELIGLSENIELSLSNVVSIYKYLSFAHPGVLDVLESTAKIGTLSNVDGRDWFIRKSIKLKTGTVRGFKGRPYHSWIVAVGPDNREGRPSFLAAIHGKGHSAFSLLKELKSRLKTVIPVQSESVEVQILGLVPPKKVKLFCSSGNKYVAYKNGRVELVKPGHQPIAGEKVFCDKGPISARFPLINGKTATREYWGHIKRVEKDQLDPVQISRGVTNRRVRARKGSVFRLTTGMSHYIERVILSEFPLGSYETLKLLALAIKNNGRFARHLRGPICDTTHCQVFNHNGEGVGKSLRRKVQKAIKDVAHLSLVNARGESPWIHFSLGGESPWSSYRDINLIEKLFGVSNIKNIIASEGQITLRGDNIKSLKCEQFRNKLSLLSCPSKIAVEEDKRIFFSGKGEGHGLGIKLRQSDALARQGKSMNDLQKTFLPHLEIK